MTHAEEADALALLRALCEYAGRPQDDRVSDVEWMIALHGKRFFACGLDILEGAFADTLLGEILRRLRKDGWRAAVYLSDCLGHGGCGATLERPLQDDLRCGGGRDPDHPVLAVARAMRDAGIISTETKT